MEIPETGAFHKETPMSIFELLILVNALIVVAQLGRISSALIDKAALRSIASDFEDLCNETNRQLLLLGEDVSEIRKAIADEADDF